MSRDPMPMVAVGKLGNDFYRELRFAITQCQPSADRSIKAFCRVLGVDPDDVAQPVSNLKEDWGEAPDVPIFHGRQQELGILKRWMIQDCYGAIANLFA